MDNISNLLTEDLGYGKIEEYVSNFDFGKFKISEKDKLSLQQKEQKLVNAHNQVIKNLYEVAKNLYDSQQILKNYGNGTFTSWFKTIGYKKDYVYRMIDKYNLSKELKNQKAIDLSVRIVQKLKNSDLDIEAKNLVLNSKNPLAVIRKIQMGHIDKEETEIDIIKGKIKYHMELKIKYQKLLIQQDELIIEFNKKLEELQR